MDVVSSVGLLMSVMATAQQPVRIEPGREDVSPHALTLRQMDIDQRKPLGFYDVFQLSKVDALGRGQNMFMRIDGAVTAVFPRSVYVTDPSGLVPMVPPGTVFWIGPMPDPPPFRPTPDTFLNLSGPDFPAALNTDTPGVSVNSIISDESYRQRRIAALLTLAAGE